MKKNFSSTFRKEMNLFTKFSLSDGLIYKSKFKISRSGKNLHYQKDSYHTPVDYWSNATSNSKSHNVVDLILDVNETIDIKLASNKELESITLYTDSGIVLFALENIHGQKVTLPKPMPGKYYIEAQFKCSRIVQTLDVII